MSRYIDADALMRTLPNDLPYKASVKRVLIQAPTADVVEVVRCKDCKYKITANFNGDILIGCSNHNALKDVCADGFCNYGERREV